MHFDSAQCDDSTVRMSGVEDFIIDTINNINNE